MQNKRTFYSILVVIITILTVGIMLDFRIGEEMPDIQTNNRELLSDEEVNDELMMIKVRKYRPREDSGVVETSTEAKKKLKN